MPDGELRFNRVQDPHLSLWQSVVAQTIRAELDASESPAMLLASSDHPLARGVHAHLDAVVAGDDVAAPEPDAGDDAVHAFLSYIGLERAKALVDGDEERAEALADMGRRYSGKDKLWAECVKVWAECYILYSKTYRYLDWTEEGRGDLNYGVIEWRIPNDAKVGIVGDWGTGMDDATWLLRDLVEKHQPAAIIHLGDIYYSGTTQECELNYERILREVAPGIPVFTLAGNHDYYALGWGFHDMLTRLNRDIPGARQETTYFCLRTEDDGWQLLAADTGLGDSAPGNAFNPRYAGPALRTTEVEWHRDKLETFDGGTVLLTHHQLYSANAAINGSLSPYNSLPFVNVFLNKVFSPFYRDKIAAWLWGHEHNFVAYRDGFLDLRKGRLVGCSAYEEASSDDPYKINYPQVQYLDPTGYRLSQTGGWYNHGYAVLDFAERRAPSWPIRARYYEYPSWGAERPANPASTLILDESLEKPSPPPDQPVYFNTQLTLVSDEGLCVGHAGIEADRGYPTLTTNWDARQALVLEGPTGEVVKHGAQVRIKTVEHSVGIRNVLGRWPIPRLYYWSSGWDQEVWTIQKRNPIDPVVHYNDQVFFVNKSWKNHILMTLWRADLKSIYLTTETASTPQWWTLQ